MSIQFRQGNLQDEEQKTILQQVQYHMQKWPKRLFEEW